jgi:Fe-S cluster assembly protein SufD
MIEQLKDRFKIFEAQLNGAGKGPWHQLRTDAMDTFVSKGFPSARDEEYRYTHVGRLLQKNIDFSQIAGGSKSGTLVKKPMFHDADAMHIYVNDGVVDLDSIANVSVDGLVISSLKDAVKHHPEDVKDVLGKYAHPSKDPFTALNTAFSLEGVFIKISKNTLLEKPIIMHYTSSANPVSNALQSRNLVLIEQGAKAHIMESYTSECEVDEFTNHVSEVVVGANAFLNYYKLQNQNSTSFHIDNTYIAQMRDSKVQAFTISLEGKMVRNNLNFQLEGENTEAHMFGLYVAHGNTHIDNHTVVDHKVPNCYSNEIYKGILDDNSKGVFNGKIFVRPDAQKTNAFQSNKNILLSDTATINTKPQLEIWADDVSCSHGCTTGQLDEEQLFYLRSRGIGKSKATAMLLHAFVNDVLDKIELEFLHDFVNDEMYNRLDQVL